MADGTNALHGACTVGFITTSGNLGLVRVAPVLAKATKRLVTAHR
jgi:hypothetical protein